ncbi:MAG: hypothetical protein HYY86_02630 [Candidatus Harrisonbacteria bacterium]|nr:hypothetical protein [Candidatus Harrisonbacteria bacterium]
MLSEKEVENICRKAKEGKLSEIAAFLKDKLGSRLTTLISGKHDASILDLWISGQEKPTNIEELRLRYGYEATALVVAEFGAETARAWFMGTHEELNDGSPACWLADHEKEEDLKLVVSDVKGFLYR